MDVNVDEEFEQAFGEHSGIAQSCRDTIHLIKSNEIDGYKLLLEPGDADQFTDLSWRLLGKYIANNSYLEKLDLDSCSLTDERMGKLFRELVRSISLGRLDIDRNEFGISGVRAMIPLLKNSPNLSILYLCDNNRIDSECFELLLSALDGSSIKELYFCNCNIRDISALNRHNLPHLQELDLNRNKIGREGCITISNLLQKEGSNLTKLQLDCTDIENDGAKIIAASLKHNTTLKELHLFGNNLTSEAHTAFLKLLVDVSSIESTYNSNHTLRVCSFSGERSGQISSACGDNTRSSNAEAAGRVKVIKYQLNSQMRKKICNLQDIEYIPGSVFADIERFSCQRSLL